MDTVFSPLLRLRLRTELRRARGEAELTQEQVARAMDWSLSKIIRIENGAVCISTNDLKALLRLYEIRDSNRKAELIELVRACHQARWSKYRADNSSRLLEVLECEEAASLLQAYSHQESEKYSKRLSELTRRLSQIRLGKKELFEVLKAIGKPEGREDIDSWFSRARDRALGIFHALIEGIIVLFCTIAAMVASASGIPAGGIGFAAFISLVALLACCIISAVHYCTKAGSKDRKREQVRAAIDAYREPS